MKVSKCAVCYLLLLLYMCIAFPAASFAENQNTKRNTCVSLDPTVYINYSASSISSLILKDTNPKKTFNGMTIALVGTVESIAENKQSLTIKNSRNELMITCKPDGKSVKESFKNIKAGSTVRLSGKMIDVSAKSFTLKVNNVQRLGYVPNYDLFSVTNSQGTTYPAIKKSIENASYIVPESWEERESSVQPEFMKYQLGEYEHDFHFDLGNNESLDLYFLEWEKLKTAINSTADPRDDSLIRLLDGTEEKARDYLTSQWNSYVTVLDDNRGTKKTNSLNYDYYVCTSRESGSIVSEEYFYKINELFIGIIYYHGDRPKHAQEVATFLGSIVAQ